MSDDVRMLIQGVCVLVLMLLSANAHRNARGSLYMWAIFAVTTVGTMLYVLAALAYMIG